MNVTSKISVDLTRQNVGQRVNAVQGDGNTRSVYITLLADGKPWTPPAGVDVAIAYYQPGGTKGMYNLLADGTAAISITGNVATIILAPQMLTASGTVQASLVFNDSQLNRLTTFPFAVSVTSNPAAGAQKVEDYLRLQWLEDKLDEYLKKFEGGVDEATVQRIVNEYLAANPPQVTETDPTVPAWAKQPEKPTYTAAEVGALPDTYTPPNQTAQQVGADPAGTAASAVSQHNTDTAAHNDLRLALQGLSDRINAVLDSDDATLDQMSEVVAYIKSNKSLIDAITTSKVSVADIVNDLVTNVADKPLSAAQGVAIKGLIEELRTLIPEAYTLPTATEDTLGGVKPVTATDAMTQPVGVDADGRLMTKPSSGGSGIAVSGATVGQTVKISAVDENGVPTAWESVDFPSGGGGEADPPLLVDYTVPDDSTASIIEFTSDDNGIAFNLNNRCYFVVDAIFPDSTPKTIGIVSNGIVQGDGPFSPVNRSGVTVTELHIFGKYTRDFGTRYTTWVQYRPNVNAGYPASSNNQFGHSDLALLMENTRGTAVKSLKFDAMGTGDTIYWAPGTRVRIWGD